jgi:non-heme chloroperoxidase
MAVIDVNGARLEYTDAGRGEPLVFVHGSLEDLRIWRRQVEQFSTHYRVIAYSRRYHHPNAAPRESDPAYTASLHAADLADLIERLNLGPAHLVASSFGGCVALALAVARSELVRSLVLAEPPLMPWLEHIPGGAPLAQAFYTDAWLPAQRAFREGESERGVRLFLDGVIGRGPSISLRPGAFDRLSPSGQHMILDNAPEMRAETLSPDLFPALTCADVAALDRPVLLLNGELSPRLFHLINGELTRCLPRAAQAVIPLTSHAIHVGNPMAYHTVVREFLQTPSHRKGRDISGAVSYPLAGEDAQTWVSSSRAENDKDRKQQIDHSPIP